MNINTPAETPIFDLKGRVIVEHLTERQIAEETLSMLRQLQDAIETLGQNPMIRAMIPGL